MDMETINQHKSFIFPDWPAPSHIKAVTTTRIGGVSHQPYDALNLGDHVGDDINDVLKNRQLLVDQLQLPSEPFWLKQVHGVHVSDLDQRPNVEADASLTRQVGTVSVVMTADCLPVLFCDTAGAVVAAAHAGWRGLHAGVLEATIKGMAVDPSDIVAWMGPAIGANAFEVGEEVKTTFCDAQTHAEQAFKPSTHQGKWMADIFMLATQRMQAAGVSQVFGGGLCTVENEQQFYSYRRDGKTGRMASLIWIEQQ